MRSSRSLVHWTSSFLGLIVATVAGVVGLTASAANAAPVSYGVPAEMVTFEDTTVAPGQIVTIRLSATPPAGQSYESGLINSFTLFDTTKWTYLDCTVVSEPATVSTSCDMTATMGGGMANTVNFDPELNPGETVVVDYRIQINAGASGSIAYSGDLINFGQYRGSLLIAESADLAVRLAASPQGLLVHSVTFTATVTNNGPSAVDEAQIRFSYPHGFVHPHADGCDIDTGEQTITCDLGAIPDGASVSQPIHLTVGLLTFGNDLTVTATLVSSTPEDTNPANDSDSATCAALTTLLVSC